MRFRWVALGVVGFAVWLVATFGVAYAVVEWRIDDAPVVVEARVDVGEPGPAIDPRCVAAIEAAGTSEGVFAARMLELVDEYCD